MKTLPKTIVGGICCIAFGIFEIVMVEVDYQHRIYVYRYVDSGCKTGSGCPFVGVNDDLLWFGLALIIVGCFLLSYRQIKHGMKFKK